MIKEAIDRLFEMGRNSNATHVCDTDDERWFVVAGDTLRPFSKPSPTRVHNAHSLVGFCDAVNTMVSEPPESTPKIFVGQGAVVADFAYESRRAHCISLDLHFSPEYVGLEKLTCGIGPKELWRELVGRMKGHIDDTLLSQIGHFRSVRNQDASADIDNVGLVSTEGSEKVSLTFKGNEEEIPVNYTFRGRIFDCFEHEVEVPLRMEAEVDNGLAFRFHAPTLNEAREETFAELVAKIRELCGNADVLEISAT